MAELGVGKEVLSICNKCKLTLSHIIVTMKDEKKPHKVECQTCKKTHVFKDPAAQKIKKATKKRSTKASRTAAEMLDMWQTAVDDPKTDSKDYSLKTKFFVGQLIDHPSFGTGLVHKAIDDNKIEVIFKNDLKTLIHNR